MGGIRPRQELPERLTSMESRLRKIERAARLNSASIGSGGLTIRDGGYLLIEQPGFLRTEYPNGNAGVTFGGIGPNPPYEHGVLINDENSNPKVLFAEFSDGSFHSVVGGDSVYMGHTYTGGPLSYVQIDEQGTVFINGEGQAWITGQGGCFIDAPGDQVTLGLSASAVFIGHLTTGDSANARLESTGLLQRSTSSIRYKQDVEDVVIDPAKVLQLRPRTWRDIAEVEEYPDSENRYIGFIAEELDEIGLTEFVEYDEDDQPDAIKYDRLAVGLVSLAQQQQERLDALEKQVDSLVRALTAAGLYDQTVTEGTTNA